MTYLSKIRLVIFLSLAAILALGYYLVIVPDNPMMRLFRGEISDVEANIIIGPYPTEADFRRLNDAKVGTIISLLDPQLPYEKILLEQEKVFAQKHAMKFMNFPMVSILGVKMGDKYDSNAKAAADAASAADGKIYVHCYLGIHRAKIVKDLVENKTVGNYLLREGERGQLARMQDNAEQLYNQKNYKEAKQVIGQMPSQDYPSITLDAWSSYHLKDIPEARKLFSAAKSRAPKTEDIETALGYCDLKENKLEDAWRRFSSVLTTQPSNESALSGAGLVLFRQDKFDESSQLLQRALAINPSDIDAQETLKRIQNAQIPKK